MPGLGARRISQLFHLRVDVLAQAGSLQEIVPALLAAEVGGGAFRVPDIRSHKAALNLSDGGGGNAEEVSFLLGFHVGVIGLAGVSRDAEKRKKQKRLTSVCSSSSAARRPSTNIM
jgi:hypothetical protein